MLPGLFPLLLLSRVQLFTTSWTAACQAPLSMDFPGKNTGVGCYFLLQGIFPTQGWNPRLLHRQVNPLLLSHQRSPFFPQSEIKGIAYCSVGGGGNQESSAPCYDHLPVMKTMRQWVRIFCLKQTVACERKAGREGFPYSFTELRLCPRHRTHLKGLLRERHVLLQFTWAGLRWPRFCVPSAGGVHRSSTVLTLSNCHSWLAFPSHSRKYRSLLFSCTTASMHFPERM